MIYVTHDQTEAMTMGDRIVVMDDGFIQQVADPITLYDKPANRFVAGFIGTPPMNFFSGSLSGRNGGMQFDEGTFSLAIPSEWSDRLAAHSGRSVTLGIRPEDIGSVAAEGLASAPRITAQIEVLEPMGSETLLYLSTGKNSFISRVDAHRSLAVGESTELPVFLPKAHMFDAESGAALV
jgi:multiple sugar transport system ATP-binding protein